MPSTVKELIRKYFEMHPEQDLEHGPVVDWVTAQWRQQHDRPPRDPWRAIRKLHEEGTLIKVRKGVYRYDPHAVEQRELEDFTSEQKRAILKRDRHRCVVCGRGLADGVELQVDHIKPKAYGGKAEIENGQTLCAMHNFRKKNYGQTETGKKMLIRLYELAKKEGDQEMMDFCKDVLLVYEQYGINGHIVWQP